MTTIPQTDLRELKTKLATTWSTGSYDRIAEGLNASAKAFIDRIPLDPGTRLLDVACGSGQVAIPAAVRGATVTGVDIAEPQIARARERAAEAGVEVRFEQGDAEALPYDDDSFDVVTSLIGAMFAPRPELVASELLRVCRPGGRVVMGNWTPQGFVGRMFKVVSSHAAPPPMPSPVLWGDEATVRERFAQAAEVRVTSRNHPLRYDLTPEGVESLFAEYYGPINRALASLDRDAQDAMRRDLAALWRDGNDADHGTTANAELIEVIAVKKS